MPEETIATHRVHPVASIFPLMEGEPFDELVKSIQTKGQLKPIVKHAGVVLDGRNRLRACEELKISPVIIEWDGAAGTPEDYIIASNLKRRHLTTSQRAMVAAELAKMSTPREGPEDGSGKPSVKKREASEEAKKTAAKALAVSKSSVERALKLKAEAPELAKKVSEGKEKLASAHKEAIGKPSFMAKGMSSDPTVRDYQDKWLQVSSAIGRLRIRLRKIGFIDSEGKVLFSEKEITKMLKDGRPVVGKPPIFAATFQTVRRSLEALAPVVRELYAEKK
jgi:ParB-like chromosome segregation protein Spo0J